MLPSLMPLSASLACAASLTIAFRGIHLRSACACAGVDTEVYTQEWFDTDYQVMLWDVAFEMLLGAGRDLLAMPPLTKETPFRTPHS